MKYIIIFFVVGEFFIYAQNTPPKKSANLDSLIQFYIEKNIELHLLKIDSLNSQIEGHKLNENYYTTSLSTQTAIFSIIVTILLVVVSFLSYYKFKSEVKSVQNKYLESIENYNKVKENLSESDSDLYAGIGLLYLNQNLPAESISYFLKGISHGCNNLKNKELLLDNIKSVNSIVSDLIYKEEDKAILIEEKEEIFRYLNTMSETKDNDIQNELASLRIALIEKTKEE